MSGAERDAEEAAAVLQALIRNACVNDGSAGVRDTRSATRTSSFRSLKALGSTSSGSRRHRAE